MRIDGVEALTDAPVLREFAVHTPIEPETLIERLVEDGFLAGRAGPRQASRGPPTTAGCSWPPPNDARGARSTASRPHSTRRSDDAPRCPPVGPSVLRSSPTTSSRRSSSSRSRGASPPRSGRRTCPTGRPRSSSRSVFRATEPVRAAGGVRAGPRGALHPPHPPPVLGRPRRLPARLVHDEVQPEVRRRRGRHAGFRRGPPGCPGVVHPGLARAPRRARGEPLCDHRHGAATLQPAAGAAGELTGLLLMRAYHEARGESTGDARSSSRTRPTAPTRPR